MVSCKFKDTLVGEEIKGWKVKKLLGTGGFGAVFFVEKDKEVAVIKLPKHEGQCDFMAEAGNMLRIQAMTNIEDRNSHIGKLLEHGAIDIPKIGRKNVMYLVEEMCDHDMVLAIRDYSNAEKEDLLGYMSELLLQLLRGIFDQHQAGLINRDIKHENIGFPERLKQVKMIDLGLAVPYVHDGDGSAIIPDANECSQVIGTTEWCSFKQEYLYQTTRVDDVWAWFIAAIEAYYLYADAPQAWSIAADENGDIGDMEPELRLLLKHNLCPSDLWLPHAHANMNRIRFYLTTLGQTDTPNYFLLAQLTQEMRSRTKKRNKAAASTPAGVKDHIRTLNNLFY